ncbi:MAG: YfjI family protein [Neomegalonema sp.]|nr:YfjI family protein [Neomegalonema sp.]
MSAPAPPVRGFAAKIPEHALRIAGVLTLYRDLAARQVDAQTMEGAITLVQYYKRELMRVFDEAAIPEALRDAQMLWDWIERAWEQPVIYLRPIYRNGPSRRFRTAKDARKVVQTLVDHGFLMRLEEGAQIDGGWRGEAWAIHGREMSHDAL